MKYKWKLQLKKTKIILSVVHNIRPIIIIAILCFHTPQFLIFNNILHDNLTVYNKFLNQGKKVFFGILDWVSNNHQK